MIFWSLFVLLVLIWYILVTAIVAYRGGKDIRNMIHDLEKQHSDEQV